MVPDTTTRTSLVPDPGLILKAAAGIALLVVLYLLSLSNYLLFHGIIEIATIAIAFSIFMLVWNNRRIITDAFYLIIGISFLFTGILDLIHTLAYKGMGVFPGSTADLPTQLWIAARFFQSITIFIATLFIGRTITRNQKYDLAIIISACTAACGLLLTSIFVWQDFPPCFIEGAGLTPFKIVSEYIISLILIATVAVLYIRRRSFDPEVWRFLIAAQVFLVLGELAFTTYLSVYGFTNMLGHLFKFVSFYFFYRAIVVVGITRPYDLLFRDLVENINDVIFSMDNKGRIAYVSPAIRRLYGYDPAVIRGQDFVRFVHADDQSLFEEWFRKRKQGERSSNEFRILTHDGKERYIRATACPVVRGGFAGGFTCTLTDITDYKRAEEAWRGSCQVLGAVLNSITVRVFWKDNNLVYLGCNTPFARDAGFEKPEDLIGKDDYAMSWREQADLYRADDRAVIAGGIPKLLYEEPQTTPSGETIHLLTSKIPLRDATGNIIGVLGTYLDITDKKMAEEKLRQVNRTLQAMNECNEALLRADNEQTLLNEICRIICESAGYRLVWVGYAEHDEDKTIRPAAWAGFDSGYIAGARLSWSDSTERGRGPAGIVIRSGEPLYVQDFVTDPLMAPWRESALQHGYRSGIALPLKDKDGDVFGALLVYSAEVNVITPDEVRLMAKLADNLAFGIVTVRTRFDRMRADQALQESEKRYRSIIELNNAGYFRIGPDGRFEDVNNAWLAMHKYGSPNEIIGKHFSVTQVEADLESAQNVVRDLLAGRSIPSGEFSRRCRDGSVGYHTFTANPVVQEGKVVGLEGFLIDITEKKQTENQRETLIRELEQKNAELARFTYTVSHELRTPLITIQGFAGLLGEEVSKRGDAPELTGYVQRLSMAVDTLEEHLRDLLKLSRAGRSIDMPKPVSFNRIAREAVDLMSYSLSEHKIQVEIAPDLPLVKVDDARIREVLINLIENAIKFMGDQSSPVIRIGFNRERKDPVFFVQDNGIGIDPRYLERIFNLFEKLDGSSRGTGIGLAIVKRIIEAHGGKIWAESEGPGKGTTFFFMLPLI